MPQVGYDARTGVALLRTAGGNLVAATRDEAGNIFMYDKNGNIYYDTGAEQGIYIVSLALLVLCFLFGGGWVSAAGGSRRLAAPAAAALPAGCSRPATGFPGP
jgi:hypothetical protein